MTAPADAAAADPGSPRALLRAMLRVRRLEEACVRLYTEQKIRGFLHVSIGEEAVVAGVTSALEPGDAIVATYREHGHALLAGIPARKLMAEMYGRAEGAATAAAGPCTCSTPTRASSAATRSWPGACPSPSGWPSPMRCRAATA
ncbi:thiamine pyrophosphate-dependent enzyme [Sinomonas sp. RB5]